jgi:hypothetical protein
MIRYIFGMLIHRLAERLGTTWPTIAECDSLADATVVRLHGELAAELPPDCALVLYGSLGRSEFTTESDVDWTLIVDGQASGAHQDVARLIDRRLGDLGLRPPGRERTFGGLTFSHDLIHRIGGEDDTNHNTTQRVLLLLESSCVANEPAYRRTLRAVLKRYITEDAGMNRPRRDVTFPMFLLNDVCRYWRTVCVDYAYKGRQRADEKWALRVAKLRMSRKLTFAAGLLGCYQCRCEGDLHTIDREQRVLQLVARLEAQLALTPLQAFAQYFLERGDAVFPQARSFFDRYEIFLQIVGNAGNREQLAGLTRDDASANAVYSDIRDNAMKFQDVLVDIFFGENSDGLGQFSRNFAFF